MIYEKKDFLTSDQLKEISRIKQCMSLQDGMESAGKYTYDGKSLIEYHGDGELQGHLYGTIFNKDNGSYIREDITGGKFEVLDLRAIDYHKSHKYDWHFDFQVMFEQTLRTNKISFTIFLNDPNDYEGGELQIKCGNEQKDYKCNKGTILFYPADKLHRVTEVTKGCRQVIVGWIYCWIDRPEDRYIVCKAKKALDTLWKHAKKNKDESFKEMFYDLWEVLRHYEKTVVKD